MPYGSVLTDSITDSSGGVLAPSSSVFRNRILNGAMQIDQRNAGASVTITGGEYSVDRWVCNASQSSKFTAQQNAASVTPPVGFSKYLGITSSAATSVGSGDVFNIAQYIEGFNFADMDWGTANAKTITLSFWVRSSLTGTFGGSLANSAVSRSYPFTYSIPSANTWTQINITIAGDTSGTWIGATNGVGVRLYFSIGTGSTKSGTAGAWAGADYRSATGATSVIGTSGATFYITGVQLEKGTTATSFDCRPYGTELALAQRYYYKATARPMSVYNGPTYGYNCIMPLPVTMRSAPTLDSGGTWTVSLGSAGTVALGSGTGGAASPDSVQLYNSASNWTTNVSSAINAGFSAEL